MANNTTLNAETNFDNVDFDQVDFEALESSDAMEALSPDNFDTTNTETNDILAEMCFLEAEDLILRGDRSGAISSYKQACRYAPTKVIYSIKLIDLLLEDNSSIKEAEELLNKALTFSPNNLELNIRLNKLKNKTSRLNTPSKKLNNFLEQSEISTQKVFRDEIKSIAAAMGVDLEKEAKKAGITEDAAAILKEIDELETKSATSSLSTKRQVKDTSSSGKSKAVKPEDLSTTGTFRAAKPEDLSTTGTFRTVKSDDLSNTGTFRAAKAEETSKITKNLSSNLNSDNTANILKEIDELETKSLTGQLKTTNLRKPTESSGETGKTAILENSKSPEKSKTSKTKLIKSEDSKRPKQISKAKWLALSLVFFIAISGLAYQTFSRPSIVLLGPAKENIAEAKEIKFEWTCDRKVAQFVLEVYEDEVFIIKEFTKETSYTPTPEQLERFSPEHTYKWRILLPIGFAGDYTSATTTQTFSVAKGFEVTSSPGATQNPPLAEPPNQQNSTPKPAEGETPKPRIKEKPITEKSNYEGEI